MGRYIADPVHSADFPTSIRLTMSHELNVTADNYGQIVNGDNNVVTMTIHGDYIVNSDRPVHPRPLPTPVYIRPKSFPDLLDRTTERDTMLASMQRGMTIELCGEHGQGKTALLRHLAHASTGAFCSDGIIYVDGEDRPLDDILQFIYDAFHESDTRYKPSEPELLRGLQQKRALIVIDNLKTNDEEFREFANKVPASTFILASSESCLTQEVDTVDLSGLPFEDAVMLIERELKRPVSPDEYAAVRTLWTSCKGKPSTLVAIANDVERKSEKLIAAVGRFSTPVPDQTFADEALESSSDDERRLLAVLALLGGVPVGVEHLGAILAKSGVEPLLNSLVSRRLVEQSEKGYGLVAALVESFRSRLDQKDAGEKALAYFAQHINWELPEPDGDAAVPPKEPDGGKSRRRDPLALLPDLTAITRIVQWGIASQKWKEVLAIIPGVEAALALSGQWAARSNVLEMARTAADGAHNLAAKAWALHQQGSLEMCRGHVQAARSYLAQALDLRRQIQDYSGVQVSRHNLNQLITPPTVTGPHRSKWSRPLAVGAGIAAIAILAFFLWPSSRLAAPVNLQAAWMLDTGSVRLTWEDHTEGETGFRLERKSPDGTSDAVAMLPANATGYIDKEITAGATYIYHAQAVGGSESEVSDYSNPDTVSVPVIQQQVRIIDTVSATGDSTVVIVETPDTVVDVPPQPKDPDPVPAAPTLYSIALDSVVIQGGSRFGATVTLTRPANAQITVAMSTDQPSLLRVPASVVIAPGKRTGRVILSTAAVKSRTRVRVMASLGDSTRLAMLAIVPPSVAPAPRLVRLSVSPRELPFAARMTLSGAVALDRPAPAGGMKIDLSLTSPWIKAVNLQPLLIPEGSSAQKFQITAVPSDSGKAMMSLMRRTPTMKPQAVVQALDPRRNESLTETIALVRAQTQPPPDTPKVLVRPDLRRRSLPLIRRTQPDAPR